MYDENKKSDLMTLIPIALIVALVPLIVYMKNIKLSGDYYRFWNGAESSPDFFSYYKVTILIILVLALLLISVIRFIKKDIHIKKTKMYIPIAIYGAFIILSTLFSEHKTVALYGFIERYEGMIVLLSYLIILFIAINVLKEEKDYKIIVSFLIFSAVIIGIIGIFQYLGHDFFQTDFGKKLMLPSDYEKYSDKLKFQFEKNMIYGTLYHYNYVGSYMAMLFPLTFTLTLLVKKKSVKIFMAVVSLLMFANWLSSHSRAGLVGGALALIVLIVFIRKKILKYWKYCIGAVILACMVLVVFNKTSSGALVNRINSLFKDAANLTVKNEDKGLKDVTIDGKKVNIIFTEETLKLELEDGRLAFKDSDNKKIKPTLGKGGQIGFTDAKYKQYTVKIENVYTVAGKGYVITVNKADVSLKFQLQKDGFKLINHKGEIIDLKPVPHWGFEGKEKLGSARGYIWSRSIPLLKETIFLGKGPDTFAIYFPQEDYIGKLKSYGTMNMLVDKAHDLYLQTALNTGVISLIALLALFIMYILSAIKVFYNNDLQDTYSIIGLAVFVAVIGYLGAGLFNDSVVSVAPVFWTLLGIGISINLKLYKKETKNI